MNSRMNKKKVIKLDPEERAIERAIERGEYISVPDRQREIKRARTIARNTFAKTRTINIRVSGNDLIRLRARAYREGVPYQTIVASLIRRATR